MKKILKTIFTEEEKIEYQEIELEMLKDGYTGKEIAEHIGVSERTVGRWKKELIDQNGITQAEINEAREKRKREEETNKIDPVKQFVLKRHLEGKSIREMASEDDAPAGRKVLGRKLKELEMEGKIPKITDEEAKRKGIEAKSRNAQKSKEEYSKQKIDEKLRKKVLSLLRKGVSNKLIRKKLKITPEILKEVKEQLISKGKITREKIDIVQEERREKDKKRVLRMLLKGAYVKEIESKITCTNGEYVQFLKELKAETSITQAQIDKAREERNQRELNEEIEFVAEGLKNGLTQQEIVDMYEQKYGKKISRQTISVYKKRIDNKGTLKEQIEVAQRERKKAKTEERRIDSERRMG